MSYFVWVGGVSDRYKTREEAENAAREWREKGYTDVQIEDWLGIESDYESSDVDYGDFAEHLQS